MDKMQTINLNSSFELSKEKLNDSSTLSSFKSSLTSLFHSSFPKRTLTKNSEISEIQSEEHSTELCEEDMDEECQKGVVTNFQKNYLELGQWPEVPVPVFQAFKCKYRGMKQKLRECRAEKDRVASQLEKYEKGEVACGGCEVLKEKNSKTKEALEQAVQLSNMLLRELRMMESPSHSESE